jgi:dipeptidyl-peptidase 4
MHKLLSVLFILLCQATIAQLKQISLEDAIIGRSTYLSLEEPSSLRWQNDQKFSFVEDDILWIRNIKSEEKVQVISLQELNAVMDAGGVNGFRKFPEHSWTLDTKLLITAGGTSFLFDPATKKTEWQIVLPPEAENALTDEKGKFMAYTIDHDLYISFVNNQSARITNDGGNGIVNGQSVHRNEFGINNGIFISPKGNYIAFYRMDESMVTDYPLVDFMGRVAEHTPVKYPMAGMNSHHVTIGIYNVLSGKTIFLKTGEPLDRYFTNLTWSPDEKALYIAELNREQNHMHLNRYDISSGEKEYTLFEEKHEKYVEPLHSLWFSKTNHEEFYYLSRRDGWFHIYRYHITGELINQVTKGEWETSRIVGFDDKEKYVFIEATRECPLEMHLYRVDIKTGKILKLSDQEGIHQGELSPKGSYLLDRFSAPELPSVTVLVSADGKVHKILHAAINPLNDYELGETRLVDITSADGKSQLAGRLVLPADFDPSKSYPVIVYVYGGPHSQLVDKRWLYAANWWQYYMATQGYISFTMDNRGTNNRGRAFETSVHRRLGIPETEDQMLGIEFLKSLPYIDEERIGVHGWSYGGFMTLNMMLRHPEVFKVGVAGGPVVDWSMYEIMYGERYMDRPEENKAGYDETSMLKHVKNLNGRLMLIHGVQDDVVVMQHSMKFLHECIKEGKQVDFFVYPEHPHNVRGRDRVHLMEKISRYFIENL